MSAIKHQVTFLGTCINTNE